MFFGIVPSKDLLLNDHDFYVPYLTPQGVPSLKISTNGICRNKEVKSVQNDQTLTIICPAERLAPWEIMKTFSEGYGFLATLKLAS